MWRRARAKSNGVASLTDAPGADSARIRRSDGREADQSAAFSTLRTASLKPRKV